MAPKNITEWLKQTRRKAFVMAVTYATTAMAAGALVTGLTFWVIFLAAKLVLLLSAPSTLWVTPFSTAIAGLVAILACADSIRSIRDEMSPLPIWLLREYLEIGPRVFRDGLRHANRAARLWQLDVETCAKVLSHLAFGKKPTLKTDLLNSFPSANWAVLVEQLRLLNGVIVFRSGAPRITLTTPLRLELQRFLVRKKEAAPVEESDEREPLPVDEPEKLDPYEILGVSSSVSVGEIKAAYRARVKECHPDRFAAMDEHSRRLAEEWTKALNAAYETLLAQRGRQRV